MIFPDVIRKLAQKLRLCLNHVRLSCELCFKLLLPFERRSVHSRFDDGHENSCEYGTEDYEESILYEAPARKCIKYIFHSLKQGACRLTAKHLSVVRSMTDKCLLD